MLGRKASLGLLLFAALALGGWQPQEAAKVDDAGLRSLLTGLGYEVKEPGVAIFEIPLTAADLNIPTRAFLTKNKAKVWLSAALMSKESVAKLSRDDLQKLLEKNVEIGPCHFMIEGGRLMMKLPLDNRCLSSDVMRSELEYLAGRVGDTKALWQR